MSGPAFLDDVERALEPFLSAPTRRAILTCASRGTGRSGTVSRPVFFKELRRGVETFARGEETIRLCLKALDRFDPTTQAATVVELRGERDVPVAHAAVRSLCEALGFETFAMTKIATASMEVVRNAVRYAGGGRLQITPTVPPGVEVLVSDTGAGIERLEDILSGRYRSRTGMGAGLRGAKAMCDVFEVQTSSAGTRVRLRKYLS